MNALACNRGFLDVVASFFSRQAKVRSAGPAEMTAKPYDRYDQINQMRIASLRRISISAAHIYSADRSRTLYEIIGPKERCGIKGGAETLAQLNRVVREIESRSVERGRFSVRVCRNKLTEELGLLVIKTVDEVPAGKLHALAQYERLRSVLKVPTSLQRVFIDEIFIVSYSVRCFLRPDQLGSFDEVADLLHEIEVVLKN